MKRSQLLGGGTAALLAAVILVLGAVAGRHAPRVGGTRIEHRALALPEGGESDRGEADGGPSAEQVADRAYPRAYVDDRRALAGRRSFERLPASPPRAAFRSARAYRTARAAAPTGAWSELGPMVGQVAPQATLFFDPDAGGGAATTSSGRVTAMAISPVCVPGDCRLWVAAAGGGIWRTADALASAPAWIPPPADLPTTSFGSLTVDPNDPTHNTLYAGSGEPNGSGDSEAGLGLFKSSDGGATWSVVPGSQPIAVNRAVAAIALVPGSPGTIYIGTAVARHGSSSVNGGRRTPPGAAPLGVYRSTDGGATWTKVFSQPQDPTPAATGVDWYAGGVNRLELDPHDPRTLYAALFGYGLWRSKQAGDPGTWEQIFHTVNQSDFSKSPRGGDMHGDRTEFDAVDAGAGHTRIFVGDSSDDLMRADVWRADDAAALAGSPDGKSDNAGWQKLSSDVNGTNGFLASKYCAPQCDYDNVVASPPGAPDTLWLGGAMNYNELAALAIDPPRSNGRTVIRSTNAGAAPADVTWQDMTLDAQPTAARQGMHPDQHAIVFAQGGAVAFIGSDGGVMRADMSKPVDTSADCLGRTFAYDGKHAVPLRKEDLLDCQRLLRAVPARLAPINAGLRTLQFQSLSFGPAGELLGGTQDNGTWAFNPSGADDAAPPASRWFSTAPGDGGQSAFDSADPTIRYHTYYNATPDVNYHGSDPTTWLSISDVLRNSKEKQSFYAPLIADPRVGGRAFIGLEHVWRTDDHGGDRATLEAHCNELQPDMAWLAKHSCGDWKPLGLALTSTSFGTDRAGEFVVAVERAPGDSATLWAATRVGRVLVSTNADAKPSKVRFTRIDSAATPGRFVSGIAIDPADADHAWISYSGYDAYTPDTPGHVFEVRYDPPAHTVVVTNRSYNIGDEPVTDIAYDPVTGDLYAGTDFGVMRRPAGAAAWQEAAPGLPRVAVYGLTLRPQARVLYAATHGRGAYSLALGAP